MQREFVLSAQLDPPLPGEEMEFWDFAHRLKFAGVDAVDINTSKLVPSADSMIIASDLLNQAHRFCEIIPHVAVRDTGLTRTVNSIYALYTRGLRSLLVITGDPYPKKLKRPDCGNLVSCDLIELLHGDLQETGICPDLKLGAAFNQNNEGELARVEAKISAGTNFFMTQPVWSVSEIRAISAELARFPFMIGVFPLPYSKVASVVASGRVPGIVVPEEVKSKIKELGQDDDAFERWSIEHSAELICNAKQLRADGITIGGAYLVTPRRKPEVVFRILRRIEELSR
jgi:5,10-methylenetetrahydrofolate reductase